MRAAMDAEFAAYVRARQQTLLRAAYLVCGDRALAEDLLQDALVKLAARWDKLRHENPDGFVRTVLYRDAVSSWRKRRRELLVDAHGDGRLSALDSSSQVADRLDLERALDGLTPRQRAVVVLRFFEDRSVRETADLLGISDGTVKSQTHVALNHLRATLPALARHEEEA